MFVYGFSGPNDWIVVLAIAAALAGLIACGVWRLIGALCRRFGLSRRTQFAIAGGLACAICAAVIVLRIDRLDALEQTCRDEVLKQELLSGHSEFTIRKHINFWDNHVSGYWGISKPYEEPQVMLDFRYVKAGRKHSGFSTCRFAKIPDSGNPPKLRFDKVEPWWPNVLDASNSWVPVERRPRAQERAVQ